MKTQRQQFVDALEKAQEIILNGSAWVKIEDTDLVKDIVQVFMPVHGGAISDDCTQMVLYID